MLQVLIAVSIVTATWLGGAPLAQIFTAYFALWFIILFVFTLVTMRLLRFVHFGMFAWVLYLTVMGACFLTGSGFKYNFLDIPEYKLVANIPVQMELIARNGVNTGQVRVINTNADPMNGVDVNCAIRYDNGAIVNKQYHASTGGLDQYPTGKSVVLNVVNAFDFSNYRSNPNDMTCSVSWAKFVHMSIRTSVAVVHLSNDYSDFTVKNLEAYAIKNVQFNCTNNKGYSVKVRAYPSYLTDVKKDTIIGAGQMEKFTTLEPMGELKECMVSNATAA